jgi:hypothetical protein
MTDFITRRRAAIQAEAESRSESDLLCRAFRLLEDCGAELRHLGLSDAQIVRALRAEADDVEQQQARDEELEMELKLEAATSLRARYEAAMAAKRAAEAKANA